MEVLKDETTRLLVVARLRVNMLGQPEGSEEPIQDRKEYANKTEDVIRELLKLHANGSRDSLRVIDDLVAENRMLKKALSAVRAMIGEFI